MKWPLGTRPAARRRGVTRQQDETEEIYCAPLSERAPTLSIGTLGAATLDGPPYSWSFIRQDQGSRRLQLSGGTAKLVKESRNFPALIDSYSVFEKAQTALDFMHMHYPEVDIPLDVIEVGIFESRDLSQSDKPMPGVHDHLKGNTLTILGSSQPVACLPCGEVGQQLQIVSIAYPSNSDKAPLNAKAVITFPTEIQQIVSQRYDTNVLAIRTLTAITLVAVVRAKGKRPLELAVIAEADWCDLGQPGVPAVDVALSPFEVAELLLVMENGNVQILSLESDSLGLETIVPNAASFDKSHSKNSCWTVGWISESEVVVAGDKIVKIFNRKSLGKPVILYCVSQDNKHIITSVEASRIRPDSILCATTEHVVWLDRNQPLVPLISWRHDREFDPTLETHTLLIGSHPVTLLSSRCTSLVTVYDIQREEDDDISSGSPYSLSTSKLFESSFYRRAGLALIPAPRSSSPPIYPQTTWLLEASPSHSLFITPFVIGGIPYVPPDAPNLWSNFEFSRLMEQSRSELGPRADRQKIHMDLRRHLLSWFHRVVADAENDDPETALDTLRAMRRVWESEENVEPTIRCITALDATSQDSEYPLDRRSRDTPILPWQPHRMICAAEASLETPSTMDCITSQSAWTYDMKYVLSCLDAAFDVLGTNDGNEPDFQSEGPMRPLWMLSPQIFADYVPEDEQIPDGIKGFVTAAAEVLTNDLSLTRHMFSNRQPIDPRLTPGDCFTKDTLEGGDAKPNTHPAQSFAARQRTGFLPAHWAPSDEDELPESSARSKNKRPGRKYRLVYKEEEEGGQGTEPKPVYKRRRGGIAQNPDLMPRTDGSKKPKTWARTAKVGSAKQALGVRILLQEWNVGEDPDGYVFKPIFAPLSDTFDKNSGTTSLERTQYQTAPPSPGPRLQNPPSVPRPVVPVVISSSQPVGPPPIGRLNLVSTSQRQAQSLGDWALGVGLGDELPAVSNTQVLPGPYGGRQQKGKAPVKKKRAGF